MCIACARGGGGGNPWRPDDSERNPRLQKRAIWEQRRGSFCLKGRLHGTLVAEVGVGAPSLLRGPVIFLSETAAWGERGRLGRRARKDFLSNGPGRLDSSMESCVREERGNSRRKSWRGVGYLQTGSPRPRLLTFWSWSTEGPTGILPGGQGPCQGSRRGAAGRACTPARAP